MDLFIDTNVFLSFYHLTSEDLEELKKLVVLMKNKEIRLYLPKQVVDETWRNRANKINDSFQILKKTKLSLSLPADCKDYPQYATIRSIQKDFEKLHAALTSAIQDDIDKHNLQADILIRDLFALASHVERSEEIIFRARERVDSGNPPGKKGSLGDAVNWESLLASVPAHHDLHLIADDSDFYSPLDSSKLNEFLGSDWEIKKKTKIFFYRKLSDFFSKHFPDINLETEQEKDKLIQMLASSPNFATTHSVISKLSQYQGFTTKQAEDLVNALIFNNQVSWILSDDDVHQFYTKLSNDKFFDLLDYSEFLSSALAGTANSDVDEIPF